MHLLCSDLKRQFVCPDRRCEGDAWGECRQVLPSFLDAIDRFLFNFLEEGVLSLVGRGSHLAG